MAEGDRRQRVISSTPHLSPDDVATRSFASSFRGFAEPEVRAFLRRIAEEMTSAQEREDRLLSAVDELEQELRAPKPLDEQQLLDALGEETARLLRTAREASDDIRRKAEERSANIMEEAQTEAHRLRTDASEILAVRSQEAETAAAEIVHDAEARANEVRTTNERVAQEQRERAELEAESIVEDARQQGRAMLDEARGARERVLSDLGRRRNLLQAQVEELRQGRDRLLEAYRVVKRTFLDATEALAQVEARAASERAHAPAVTAEDIEAFALATDATVDVPTDVEASDDVDATADVDREAAAASSELRDVDSLFARIRAGQSDALPATDAAPPVAARDGDAGKAAIDADADVEPAEFATGDAGAVTAPPEGPARADEAAGAAEEAQEQEAEAPDDAAPQAPETEAGPAVAWRNHHAAAVAPLLPPLLKRSKRAAQDDQNALLDAVRRHRGRPTAEQVLRGDEELVAAWTDIVRDALDTAYGAGRDAVGAAAEAPPDDLVRDAAEVIAFPLRDRLAAAIDDVDGTDTSGLVERIGARYREWKNQQLELALGDVVVMAWSRGVYDGVDDGTVLQWIPSSEGQCADCDDNALEPTVKGENFPTGQARPPAHPGCRCLLAPADALAELGSS